MNRQAWTALAAGLTLIGSAAALLAHLEARQKLGQPGVRVVNVAIQGVERSAAGPDRFFVAGTNSVDLPASVLDYASESLPVDKVVHDWLPEDTTYGQRFYRADDGFAIMNLVVLMGTDRTSIHKPQYCLQGTGWKIESAEQTSIEMDRPYRYHLPVAKLTLTRALQQPDGRTALQRGIFVYWFVAENAVTGDHREQMWSLGRHLVLHGELQRWAYVICFAAFDPRQEPGAWDRLTRFVRASVPEYQLAAGPPFSPP